MPVLQVGATRIPYTITRSPRARRQRVVITAGVVEVIAPETLPEDEIVEFMHRKRRWVFDTRATMLERTQAAQGPKRYVSGAKVPFRGRQMRLRVEVADVEAATVAYRNGFEVAVPNGVPAAERDLHVEAALTDWMKAHLREDVAVLMYRYAARLGVEPKGFRLKDQKHLWGSCGKDGTIYLNWHLVYAPRVVLEYAVVHELAHLRHRTHSRAFWGLVKKALPGYETARAWLDRGL